VQKLKDQESFSGKLVHPTKLRRFLGWLLIAGALVVILFIVFPHLPDPTCAALLVRSEGDVAIPLPANCVRVSGVPVDNMVKYLEKERNNRRLIFKEWITCKTASQTPASGFAFEEDQRWLPSYIPGTYQFRRTVIILPYGQDIPHGSPVAAEVSLMPWRRYISQIIGQCDGKFSVWK
jgi:hypothetical protein